MKHSPINRKPRKRTIEQRRYDTKLKAQLIEIYGNTCMCCGNPPDWRGLQLHHKRHKGMGGTTKIYELDEVELLCGKCHNEEHGIKEVK